MSLRPELDLKALAARAAHDSAAGVGATFTASWDVADGCAACGEEVSEGDRAGYLDDEVVCLSCHEEARGDH